MKQVILEIIVACAWLAIAFRVAHAAPDDVSSIRGIYSDYKAALLAKQGEKACELLTDSSIKDYDTARSAALHSERSDINKLPFIQKLMTLRMRLEFPFERLSAMNGRKLCEIGVERGWIDRDGTSITDVGKVAITDKTARANIVREGKEYNDPRAPGLWFGREAAGWRVDLSKTAQSATPALEAAIKMAEQKGLTEDRFLIASLQLVTGTSVPTEIWSAKEFQKGLKLSRTAASETPEGLMDPNVVTTK